MSSLTYQQSVFKRYHSDKHFSEFYLEDGGKSQRTYVWTKISSLSPYAYRLISSSRRDDRADSCVASCKGAFSLPSSTAAVRTLLQSDAALKCHTLPSPFYSVHSFSISSPFPSPENIKITESVVQHNSRPIGLTLSTLNTLIISSVSSPDGASDRYAVNDLDLSCNCCVAKVCCKSARHWLSAAPGKSKQTTDESGVGHDGVGHDSCCVSARHCYLTLPTSSTTAGPIAYIISGL